MTRSARAACAALLSLLAIAMLTPLASAMTAPPCCIVSVPAVPNPICYNPPDAPPVSSTTVVPSRHIYYSSGGTTIINYWTPPVRTPSFSGYVTPTQCVGY